MPPVGEKIVNEGRVRGWTGGIRRQTKAEGTEQNRMAGSCCGRRGDWGDRVQSIGPYSTNIDDAEGCTGAVSVANRRVSLWQAERGGGGLGGLIGVSIWWPSRPE